MVYAIWVKKIEFIGGNKQLSAFAESPIAAVKGMPDWYKDMSTFHTYDKLVVEGMGANLTAKKCIPLRDALTTGYLIPSICDVQVGQEGNYISWVFPQDPITTHPTPQMSGYSIPDEYNKEVVFKWYNPWIIKTPPGYSTLFVHPLHRNDLPFYSLPGVVDTDTHPVAVNLPFFMKQGFNGIIEKGTPIIQVIPFKRESWKMEVDKSLPENLAVTEDSFRTKIMSYYANNFWSRKEYK